MHYCKATGIGMLLMVATVFAQQPAAAPAKGETQVTSPTVASAMARPDDPQTATTPTAPAFQAPADPTELIIDRIVGREHFMVETLSHLTPLLETYLQQMKPDPELGYVPASDQYFLGKLDMSHHEADEKYYVDPPSFWQKLVKSMNPTMPIQYVPRGFISTMLIDAEHFDRQHFDFTYVHREFLGDVRCYVFDVSSKKGSGADYSGRIWVEDQDYNIVRTKGVHRSKMFSYEFHSDVWRQNLRPGIWLPTYVYSEESDMKFSVVRKLRFKSQTRMWGYDARFSNPQDELTRVLVDDPNATKDRSEAASDMSPVQSQRRWEMEAQENVVERLEKAGLLAPKGEVDKVLEQVVTNLIVTNNLDIQPEVHCRVLLTAPLESFTVGHTIVLSRGLLDVLPDETSLAMALGHELAHIALGHRLDTKYAFNDRMIFPDEKTFHRLGLGLGETDEAAADAKSIEMLKNSPYKDKLASAGLFLKVLQLRSSAMDKLLTPRLGSPMMHKGQVRMAELMNDAPPLLMNRTDQIAALPLGGRIRMDAWTNQVELNKNKPPRLLNAREKMPFEVTPLMPYIHRIGPSNEVQTAEGTNSTKVAVSKPQ